MLTSRTMPTLDSCSNKGDHQAHHLRRVESSSSKPCREEGFGNGDQDGGCRGASQMSGIRKCLKTSASGLSRGTRKLCHFRRGQCRWWPSYTAGQRSLLISAPSREESCWLPLFCPQRNKHVRAQRRRLDHPKSS